MDGDTFDFLRDLGAVDAAAAVILAIAILRGLFKGMIRMAFSLAALAAACIAVRFGTLPFALWLAEVTQWTLSPLAGQIVAGSLLGVGTLVGIRLTGRGIRRGFHAAGLGFADRLGGGAFGAAEGALIITVLMFLASATIGTDHPALRDTRTLAALQTAADTLRPPPPDVAAPPRKSTSGDGGYN
ncbi:MAG: CvpA family protein [bacterium]|nr:CvpA family protein [bacterium]